MKTRIKICGITNLEDALIAVAAGADSLGFVFYGPSPRNVSPAIAAEIISKLPPFVTTTALFVNEDEAVIKEIMLKTGIDLLQFHGNETDEFCQQFARPYIKALRMKPGADIEALANSYSGARGILLDAYRAGVPGGTGESFDWERIPQAIRSEIILAGGLTPENVADAVQTVSPYAVDVSGGVEASKGKKDPVKVNRFVDEVLRVDQA